MAEPLQMDEGARRAASLEDLEAHVGGEVEGAIADRAAQPVLGESARIAAVATDLRTRAVDDVVQGEGALRRGRVLARVAQLVDLAFGLVYVVLGMRFVLALLAARASADFSRLVMAVSDPLYAPFRGIIVTGNLGTGHQVVLPLLFALAVYVMAHAGIRVLLRVVARRPSPI